MPTSDLQKAITQITKEGLSPKAQNDKSDTAKELNDHSESSKDYTETADQSKNDIDVDYVSRLELIYRWFDNNRAKFIPAVDVLTKNFFTQHKINVTKDLHVMIQEASDPDFDHTILFLQPQKC